MNDLRLAKDPIPKTYWAVPLSELFAALASRPGGLSEKEAAQRLRTLGPNELTKAGPPAWAQALLGQVRSPLVLLLFGAAILSGIAGEWTDVAIIVGIVVLSVLLGFVQEFRASQAVEKLKAGISARVQVVRDGSVISIESSRCVPGDVVLLSAGSLVPADAVVIESKDCFVMEAVLTGETFPVEKRPGMASVEASLSERTNVLHLGTSLRSGTAQALVVKMGAQTEYGKIADRLSLRAAENEFDRGIRQFGTLLLKIIGGLVFVVLAASLIRHLPAWEALLFAIALSVGLAPELLPAIVSVTLAHGARQMAKSGVIVRRLSAIENFGCMDVFCTDKTGTITEGSMRFDMATDPFGQEDVEVLRRAYENALYQTGMQNPIDEALLAAGVQFPKQLPPKIDEVPYDFVRKRMTVVVGESPAHHLLICKGAAEQILSICTKIREAGKEIALDPPGSQAVLQLVQGYYAKGLRVLAVATKEILGNSDHHTYGHADESDLTLVGFLLFWDPPKAGVKEVLESLRKLGVSIKVITGDHPEVAAHVAREVGLDIERIVTGRELSSMRDEALWHLAERVSVFAQVDPNQKERIILALKKTGHVVGYLGDGINDAPALHSADVGISVDTAVDVAREAADFVLLRNDLRTLKEGIQAGRATFANTLKYILTTESANFGNMLSMAVAAMFLPFLPLLAPQVLLNNFLSDIPAMAIANDSVDADIVARPRKWDIKLIRRFMFLFGSISTVFDLLTFYILHNVLKLSVAGFRTGWFIESLLTELAVALVVRTQGPSWCSSPSRALFWSTLAVALLAIGLPLSPLGPLLQFISLPPNILLVLIGITLAYVAMVEGTKRIFFRRG